MTPVRVLVVDDSATMRGLISLALRKDPEIEVVGTAGDPLKARDAIKAHNPDVITLDVEMPGMNGLDFLEKIVRLRPTPVIMVSNLTGQGTETAIEAMQIGAVDCISKPQPGEAHPFAELPRLVKAAAGARVRPRPSLAAPAQAPARRPLSATYESDGRLVAIGSSTGGVEALSALIGELPENCPPIVIVQHMPPDFTASLAKRLDRLNAPQVLEAFDGAPIKIGHIYIAPGGANHLEVEEIGGSLYCRLRSGAPVNGHSPSADVLFASVAKTKGPRAVGIILTGMGRDGAQGLLAMRQAGAHTIGQDEASSLIYGMPKVAFEVGAVERQLPLDRIASAVLATTNLRGRAGRETRCHSQTN